MFVFFTILSGLFLTFGTIGSLIIFSEEGWFLGLISLFSCIISGMIFMFIAKIIDYMEQSLKLKRSIYSEQEKANKLIEKIAELNSEKVDKDELQEKKNGICYEEVRLEYYNNGQVKRKSQYKDDKLNGETILYYDNGQVKEKIQYKDGKLI